MIECPCHNCICVPICRQKEYFRLIDDCELLLKLLYKSTTIDSRNRKKDYPGMISEVYKELQPHHWIIEIVRDSNNILRIYGVDLHD